MSCIEWSQPLNLKKKSRKAVRWCARLIRSIYWLDWFQLIYELIGLTLFIWFLTEWVLFIWLIDWLNESNISHLKMYAKYPVSHGCKFHEILHQNQNIPWLQISWDIAPESKYPLVADFMRYYTRIKISRGCKFYEILRQDQNINGCRFSDISNQDMYVCLSVCLLVCSLQVC